MIFETFWYFSKTYPVTLEQREGADDKAAFPFKLKVVKVSKESRTLTDRGDASAHARQRPRGSARASSPTRQRRQPPLPYQLKTGLPGSTAAPPDVIVGVNTVNYNSSTSARHKRKVWNKCVLT
jgi:hypothetical protein